MKLAYLTTAPLALFSGQKGHIHQVGRIQMQKKPLATCESAWVSKRVVEPDPAVDSDFHGAMKKIRREHPGLPIKEMEEKLALAKNSTHGPFEMVIADPRGACLPLARDFAKAFGTGYMVLTEEPDYKALVAFLLACPKGVVVVPSTQNRGAAHQILPEVEVSRGHISSLSPVNLVASQVKEKFAKISSTGVDLSGVKFLYAICDKDFYNQKKVFGFHNEADTSKLNSDILLNHMGSRSLTLAQDPHAVWIFSEGGSEEKIVDFLIPDDIVGDDRRQLMKDFNEKTKGIELKGFGDISFYAAMVVEKYRLMVLKNKV